MFDCIVQSQYNKDSTENCQVVIETSDDWQFTENNYCDIVWGWGGVGGDHTDRVLPTKGESRTAPLSCR